MEPFIRNHQFNFIQEQTKLLQSAILSATDTDVLNAVRYNAEKKILNLFLGNTQEQLDILKQITNLRTEQDFENYIMQLSSYLIDFPAVTETQLKKLFRKNKKMNLPNVSQIAYTTITYLGWNDIGLGKKFIVYPWNGRIIGIEGQYTLTGKEGICSLCNQLSQVALVTSKIKTKGTDDNYRAIGNYMCLDSQTCNQNITDIGYLENFIQDVLS